MSSQELNSFFSSKPGLDYVPGDLVIHLYRPNGSPIGLVLDVYEKHIPYKHIQFSSSFEKIARVLWKGIITEEKYDTLTFFDPSKHTGV